MSTRHNLVIEVAILIILLRHKIRFLMTIRISQDNFLEPMFLYFSYCMKYLLRILLDMKSYAFRQVSQIALMDNRRTNCMLIISTTLTRRTMIYCLRSWCSRSSFTRVSVFRRVIRLSGLRFLWFLAIRVSAVFSFLFVSVSSCLFSCNC